MPSCERQAERTEGAAPKADMSKVDPGSRLRVQSLTFLSMPPDTMPWGLVNSVLTQPPWARMARMQLRPSQT